MDILQRVPVDRWSLLRDSLKRDWPTYAYHYYFIDNGMKRKVKDPLMQLDIFCPDADVYSGVYIGISTQIYYVVIIFTFPESRNLLRRVLKETKIINWSETIEFDAVHPLFDDVFKDFIETNASNKNIVVVSAPKRYLYFKSKDECLEFEVLLPKECELRHLNESHIPLIHSVWPRREEKPEKSIDYFASLVRLNRGIGLFLKEDDSLVSWILQTGWGDLGLLHTVKEHRRKGYARIVEKAMAKEIAEEENLDSLLFIAENNIISQKLTESLGYKRLMAPTWYFMKHI